MKNCKRGKMCFSFSEIFNVASASSPFSASKQNASQNNKIETNESMLVSNEEKNLETLLNSTLTGKVLLAVEKDEPLTNPQRLNLVKIIGNNILQSSPADHVKASTYVEWAQSICKIFKKESPSVYFHNKYMITLKGVINKCCGKLPDQIGNLKRKYRQSGIIPKRARNSRSSSCSSTATLSHTPSTSEYDDSEENLTWLKNSSDPWMTVEEKWQSTTKARIGKLPIEQYFQQYPATTKVLHLQKPHGYSLLKLDFDFLYGEKTANLTDTFPLVKEKIFGLAARKNSKDKYIQTLLSLNKTAEEISKAGILLIPSLLSVSKSSKRYGGLQRKMFAKASFTM